MIELFTSTKEATKGQRKWLFRYLSKEQQQAILDSINGLYVAGDLKSVKVSQHLREKLVAGKTVMEVDVLSDMLANQNYNVIEVNKTNGNDRVLLRSTTSFTTTVDGRNTQVNQCVVMSLDDQRIITAYVNRANDNHYSIRQTIYEQPRTFKLNRG